MFDRNSDYALNKKDPDAIVCKKRHRNTYPPDPCRLLQCGGV